MAAIASLRVALRAIALLIVLAGGTWSLAAEVKITFDLPDTIECRDATPKDFALANPALKVIEARLRISSRIVEGTEQEIVDFLYFISSPDRKLKFQDYLPNTTLESQYVDDHIEVTEANEDSKGTGVDAKVSYQVFSLGGSKSKNTKKSESNRYKQVAAKALVVASGTTDREHGVFFKLHPSKAASLEGAKEFTFLATVPRTWRGGWCTVSCAARANKKSFFTTSIAKAGVSQAQIGLYLSGDGVAAGLAEELRRVHDVHSAALARNLDGDDLMETMYAATSNHKAFSGYTAKLCGIFKGAKFEFLTSSRDPMTEAQQAVIDVQERLSELGE